MTHLKHIILLPIGLLSIIATSQAATVAYWRFEGDYTDSSGAGNNLTPGNSGTGSSIVTTTGMDFFDPVPQTSAANTQTYNKSRTASENTSGYALTTNNVNLGANFTVESMFNVNSKSTSHDIFLINQWNNAGTPLWSIYLETADGSEQIRFVYKNGSTSTFVDSGFSYDTNTDYYLGMTVDMDDTTTNANNSVSFYLKNLETGIVQQTLKSNYADMKTGSSKIAIGGRVDFGYNSENMSGQIDEVRISDSLLSTSELLVIPEPSTLVLVGITGIALLMFRKRK
ncbi:PEP-CTERM sorting domain-containing protein [Kiritimatiellaeota bacterium B1221]|nr:PEP-CTERM sorting domain-containing protein [Kiritimatiellaeota bacterium B1221]